MIITCPNCSARYKVKDELIQAKGKRVKCKKCESVFLTFPDRDPVLESVAPVAPAEPAPQPAPVAAPSAPPIAQATVKVDRSQLDKFLQNNSLDGTQSTVKMDPDQFKKFQTDMKQSAQVVPGATVQVDRSQIEAFMKEASRPTAPSSSETVQLDPSALSSMGLGNPQTTSAQTIAMPRSAFAEPMAQTSGPDPAHPPKAPVFAEPTEPAFPSDEELGIAPEDNYTPPAPAASSTPSAAPVESKPFAAPPPEKLYQAEVEGQVYPNLPLDSIARWVRERRLLESDLVAVNGTQDYRTADSFPEIARFFLEIAEANPEPPPVKKGFFARLFSFGK